MASNNQKALPPPENNKLVKHSAWELEVPSQQECPSLEDVLDRANSYGLMQRQLKETGQISSARSDIDFYREPTTKETSNLIYSLPSLIWESIWQISKRYPGLLTKYKSVVEGCMIHCGLLPLERVLSKKPRTQEARFMAFNAINEDKLERFVDQKPPRPTRLGNPIRRRKRIHCINMNDKARAEEIASNYGWDYSDVIILVMIYSVAHSESFLPKKLVETAYGNVRKFESWLEKHY